MARRAGGRDERGAVAVFVAATLAVLLLMAAFAIDLNMQRVAARDAQAAADLIALDVARELDGRKFETYSQPALTEVFTSSVERNARGLGADPDSFTFELVVGQPGGGYRAASAGDTPDAVRVRTSGGVDRFFYSGTSGVARSAVATADNSACFRVGSFVAGLDSSRSALLAPLLNALLGSSVNLNAVSYQGLANVNVSLLSLVETGRLGVGTVDELLDLPALRVADLFVASAQVLDQQGNLAQANVLRALATQVGTPTVRVADLVSVAPGADAALDAGLNVLDLVSTSAFVIQKGRTVNIPDLAVNVPGAGSVTATLTVVEPTQPGCRSTGGEVETAQVRLNLSMSLAARSLDAGIATVTVDPTQVDFSIDLGKAIARLTGVVCNDSGPDYLTLELASAVLGSVNLSASSGVHLSLLNPTGGILGSILGLLNVTTLLRTPYVTLDSPLSISAFTAASAYDKTLRLPLPGSYTVPVGSGSGSLLSVPRVSVSSATAVKLHYWQGGLLTGRYVEMQVLDTAPLFNLVVNPVLDVVTSRIATPLVNELQRVVLTPLLTLLGVQLGGADVFAQPTPGCGVPKLVE